jgi:FixJ family two-component response regulator
LPKKPFTVHVVDDDDSICRALKRLFKASGFQALTFESAEDFLESTTSMGKGCLILDISLPGMTGLDLQEKIAPRGANCPVIIITAHDNPQWREQAIKAGAVAYLKKPFGEQSLLDAVSLCRQQTDEE